MGSRAGRREAATATGWSGGERHLYRGRGSESIEWETTQGRKAERVVRVIENLDRRKAQGEDSDTTACLLSSLHLK